MNETPVILHIPESVFIVLMCSWVGMVIVGTLFGFFCGVSNECRRRMR